MRWGIVSIKSLANRKNRFARNKFSKNSFYDPSFFRLDDSFIAIRPHLTVFVDAKIADGLVAIAISIFADYKTSKFLSHLAAVGLLFEIVEIKLINDATHLDRKFRVLIFGIEAICDGDKINGPVLELGTQRQKMVVITRQPREVVDKDDLEFFGLTGFEKIVESRAIANGAGACLVPKHMRIADVKPFA